MGNFRDFKGLSSLFSSKRRDDLVSVMATDFDDALALLLPKIEEFSDSLYQRNWQDIVWTLQHPSDETSELIQYIFESSGGTIRIIADSEEFSTGFSLPASKEGKESTLMVIKGDNIAYHCAFIDQGGAFFILKRHGAGREDNGSRYLAFINAQISNGHYTWRDYIHHLQSSQEEKSNNFVIWLGLITLLVIAIVLLSK